MQAKPSTATTIFMALSCPFVTSALYIPTKHSTTTCTTCDGSQTSQRGPSRPRWWGENINHILHSHTDSWYSCKNLPLKPKTWEFFTSNSMVCSLWLECPSPLIYLETNSSLNQRSELTLGNVLWQPFCHSASQLSLCFAYAFLLHLSHVALITCSLCAPIFVSYHLRIPSTEQRALTTDMPNNISEWENEWMKKPC